MSDTETEREVVPAKRPRRPPLTAPPAAPELPSEIAVPPTETGEASTADTAASAAPALPVATEPAPEAEAPEAAARRGKRDASTAAVTVPWESALPGVRSSEIRAELARREQRAATLLAERERIVAEMETIEAALDSIGEDAP